VPRPVANGVADARQIGDARANVLETRRVGLRIRQMLDHQIAVNQAGHALRQIANRNRFIAAEVEHLSRRGRASHQVQHAANDVRDMAETAHLSAVVVDHQRTAPKGLIHKAR